MKLTVATESLSRQFEDRRREIFLAHPSSVNETYREHLGCALSISRQALWIAIAAAAHALMPGLFTHAASDAIGRLNESLSARNRRAKTDPGDSSDKGSCDVRR
jgi:hypothetical protein